MMRWTEIIKKLLLHSTLRIAAVVVVAAMAMILVRYGPGFTTDDRDLDPSVSTSTRTALHTQHLAEVRGFIMGILRGNLGESSTLGVPVRELIAERGPATLRILTVGTGVAWLAGLLWALVLGVFRAPVLAGASTLANACLLCLPTAAIAALLLNADWPAEIVLAVALAPRIFPGQPRPDGAGAGARRRPGRARRGLGTARILCWYVLPRIARPHAGMDGGYGRPGDRRRCPHRSHLRRSRPRPVGLESRARPRTFLCWWS